MLFDSALDGIAEEELQVVIDQHQTHCQYLLNIMTACAQTHSGVGQIQR